MMFVPHVGQEEIKRPTPRAMDPDMINPKQVRVCARQSGAWLPILRDTQQAPDRDAWCCGRQPLALHGPILMRGPDRSALWAQTARRWTLIPGCRGAVLYRQNHTRFAWEAAHTHSYTNKAGAQRHRGMNPFKCMGSNTHRAHTHTHTHTQHTLSCKWGAANGFQWERRRARLYPLSVEDLIIQNGPGGQ